MKCREILDRIEREYPPSCAMDWDNPGLLVGDDTDEVKAIMVALDASDDVIDQAIAEGVQLLVTHHPMIFGSIRQVNNHSLPGRRILRLIRNGIGCYAMHTNFDIRGMAALNEAQLGLVETEVLEVTGENDRGPEGIGRVGNLKEPMSCLQLAAFVKETFGLDAVRCYGTGDPRIVRAAVCGGSGSSMIEAAKKAGAQVLITGDISYHTGTDAADEGLLIIDAGHFGTEKIFIPFMTEKLKQLFPDCRITAADQKPPFRLV